MPKTRSPLLHTWHVFIQGGKLVGKTKPEQYLKGNIFLLDFSSTSFFVEHLLVYLQTCTTFLTLCDIRLLRAGEGSPQDDTTSFIRKDQNLLCLCLSITWGYKVSQEDRRCAGALDI